MSECPHCHIDRQVGTHICQDNLPWTREERDALRSQLRRRYPNIRFTPTFQSERMGRHSRRDLA